MALTAHVAGSEPAVDDATRAELPRRPRPQRGSAHRRPRRRAGLPDGGGRPHGVALHPLGAPVPSATAAPVAPRRSRRQRVRRRGALGPRPLVAAASHPGGSGRGRPRHPAARRPGRGRPPRSVGRGGGAGGNSTRRRPRRLPRPGGHGHVPACGRADLVAGGQCVAARPGGDGDRRVLLARPLRRGRLAPARHAHRPAPDAGHRARCRSSTSPVACSRGCSSRPWRAPWPGSGPGVGAGSWTSGSGPRSTGWPGRAS